MIANLGKRLEAADCTLSQNRVDVWLLRLDIIPEVVDALAGYLASDERQRAARFRFERHRQQFILARGGLRTLLAAYLNTSPERLRLVYNRYGKPALADEPGVSFNLAHSHELAVYAITDNHAVGIDIEHWRPLAEMESLAARCFSAREFAVFQQLPAEQKPEAFFNCWTRKEAYIKALGQGLSHPLDQFDVSFRPGEPPRLLDDASDPQAVNKWTFHAFQPAAEYTAALVGAGQGWTVRSGWWNNLTI
ncbi:MAG TPA: 4'-phosphopantetheinyl transferase superfamily protein [Phototrophicaceae bacterium]|nr:4'-phosphopantetheinyl transferase superfamily protein [Phototrophicaceae bacterium]